MTVFSEAFAAALQHHRAGDARKAEETCRHILEEQPQNVAALHLLGVLAQQAGRAEEALPLLSQAVVLSPDKADFHYNLGVVQQMLGRKDEAQSSYREALRLNPDHAGALNNLGNVALNAEQLEEAEDYLRRALRVQPDSWAAHHNLALVCKRRGKLEEAVSCFRQAVRLCPDNAAIHFQLGQTLEECGRSDQATAAFRQSGRQQNIRILRRVPSDGALAAFREAVRLQPDNPSFQCALGNLLILRRQPGEALPHYEQAQRGAPSDAANHSNLGNVLTLLGRPQEAEAHCREAIRLGADGAVAHHNLANALAVQCRLDEALQSIEEALRLSPEFAEARNCRALLWLQRGRFAEGWPEYEWRWKLGDKIVVQCPEPLWDGSSLKGKSILLWAEQGLGDTLQAIRFAPLVKERGGTVVVECQAPLTRLLSRCSGIDRLVPCGSAAPTPDVQAPLMSLAGLLGIRLETLPAAEVPYIYADPVLIEQWRRELADPAYFKIGIAWQGNPSHLGDRDRSIPLRHFAPLGRLSGIRLISLQKGPGHEQLREVEGLLSVTALGSRLDDFADTAAVMKCLDLVITVDTAVAHLAGALGVPVWLALTFAPDWRWLLDREDSPWYPSMRLFRQSHRGDWQGVFTRMAGELQRKIGTAAPLDGHIPVGRGSDSVEVNMTAMSEGFAAALQHHRAGDARKAEETCRHILEEQPQNVAALHLLGVLAQQAGRAEEALPLLSQAVALSPDKADFHYNLGVVQQMLGRRDEAQSSYREALRLNPDHAGALNNLGNVALNAEQLEEAEDYLRRALRVQPDSWAAHHNLALVCKRRGKLEEAVPCFRQAVRLCPDDAAIHFQLGQTLEKHSQFSEATSAYREAVRLQPDNPTYRCWLGNLLIRAHQLDEAVQHYEIALRLQPEAAVHHSNLGNVLSQLGRPHEGEAHCREAIRLQADFANAYSNLANALAAQGRLDEALQTVEETLRIDPESPGARNCRALWWLQLGRFAEGWPEYEWRWKVQDVVGRQCPEPLWDGSPLNGKTILLWAEQGLGDTLQAIRFTPLVKERGGTVVVACQESLVPLLSRCAGFDRLVPLSSPTPAADVQAPLMSLPWLLGITLEALPAVQFPYIYADPVLVKQWRRELEGPPSLRIGIAWQGNPFYCADRMRSIPLKHFAALARLPGVRLFSLQKGVGSEQRRAVAEQFYVVDLACRLDETTGAFMDTAAVMQNLDLVITSDTSVAHLAGALGVPVWVGLGVVSDWRFFHQREDNPWYPTMRLFRQTRLGDWDGVFARMAEELSRQAVTEKEGIPRVSAADLAQRWNRALGHFQAGEQEAAQHICRELLDAEPCFAEALNLLGAAAQQAGQNELARQRLERAASLQPPNAGFHYNLGVALQALGQAEQAAASYRQTLRLQPEHPAALNNLGYALHTLGQDAEARQPLEQAVGLQPDNADPHFNLGSVYLRLQELEKAEAVLKQAVRLRPDHASSHSHLGVVFQRQGRLDEALAHFHKAVQLSPNSTAVHHNNLGLVLGALGRYEEALASFEQAIRLDPEGNARYSRAMIWLLHGDFEQGWRDYEYRWQSKENLKPVGPQPLWDGSPLNGQTILLWAEQGLGDSIQFLRYVSPIKQHGGTVVVQCPAQLTRLLSSCPGIDRLVSKETPLPAYDVQAPLLSLPRILGTTLETIPANVPYLFADNDLLERWRHELSGRGGFRVGIAWQGNPNYTWDRGRSIPLRHFAPLARVAGVRLISLQKGPGVEQLGEVSGLFPVTDLGSRLDETAGAFMDTAAVMKCLDLVITSDTSVAHLAGALGVPVWLALTFAPEWRWLLEREDSPWYPSMRLFRQSRRGDWQGVFTRMAGELRRKIGTAAPLDLRIPVAPGELLDKITILEIKMERIRDTDKLANVRAELAELTAARERCLPNWAELARLTSALKAVNEALWQIEDDLRDCERGRDFGPRFIQLARSVYQHNDRRAALKRQINKQLGSPLVEEKSYASY